MARRWYRITFYVSPSDGVMLQTVDHDQFMAAIASAFGSDVLLDAITFAEVPGQLGAGIRAFPRSDPDQEPEIPYGKVDLIPGSRIAAWADRLFNRWSRGGPDRRPDPQETP